MSFTALASHRAQTICRSRRENSRCIVVIDLPFFPGHDRRLTAAMTYAVTLSRIVTPISTPLPRIFHAVSRKIPETFSSFFFGGGGGGPGGQVAERWGFE